MKRKLFLKISLTAVIGVCASIAMSSVSGAEPDTMGYHRTAAQAYRRICNASASADAAASNSDGQTIVGYYKDIPITLNQLIYQQARNRIQINPEDPTWKIPDKTEKELILEVAQDLYTYEQAKELGLYPSEEEIDRIFDSETESFQKNPEENLEYCSQVGFSRDEMNTWMAQQKIEAMARGRFGAQVLVSLEEEEEIEDEVLAELVQAFVSREDGTDPLLLISQIYDRYVALQIEDQITYGKNASRSES